MVQLPNEVIDRLAGRLGRVAVVGVVVGVGVDVEEAGVADEELEGVPGGGRLQVAQHAVHQVVEVGAVDGGAGGGEEVVAGLVADVDAVDAFAEDVGEADVVACL